MSKHAFNQAARFFLETVSQVKPSQWDDPALGVWNVRDLTGHTARALTTAMEYGAQRAERIEISGPIEYYRRTLAAPDANERVAERGHQAGADLGPDPIATVRATVERAVPAVNNIPSRAVIAVPAGAMLLEDYLRTRVLELTVHTLDLAKATGQQARPPWYAISDTLHLLADLALESEYAGELALLATGRGLLSDRFSVLG